MCFLPKRWSVTDCRYQLPLLIRQIDGIKWSEKDRMIKRVEWESIERESIERESIERESIEREVRHCNYVNVDQSLGHLYSYYYRCGFFGILTTVDISTWNVSPLAVLTTWSPNNELGQPISFSLWIRFNEKAPFYCKVMNDKKVKEMALIIWVKLRASARFLWIFFFLFKQCQGLHIRFKSDIKRPSGVAEGAKTVTQTQH